MPDAIGRFHWIVIDTVDPARIAPFWCALLGVEQRGWFGDDYLMLTADEGAPPVAFQRVPEAKSVKNRLHIDLQSTISTSLRESSRSAGRPSRASWRCRRVPLARDGRPGAASSASCRATRTDRAQPPPARGTCRIRTRPGRSSARE